MKFLQAIKKALAILLAVFLLITSTGIELNAHYCKTKLVSINIWNEAKSCSQSTETIGNQSSSNTETNISKQNCCGSKTVFNKANIESETLTVSLQSPSEYFTINTSNSITYSGTFTVVSKKEKYHYLPPKNSRSVLFQNFRI